MFAFLHEGKNSEILGVNLIMYNKERERIMFFHASGKTGNLQFVDLPRRLWEMY